MGDVERSMHVCTMTKRWCLDVQFDLGHLTREFTAVFCTAVYIPSHADTTLPRDELHDVIDRQEALHPKGAFTVTGDFNKAKLKKVLPVFSQQVDVPSLSHNILIVFPRTYKGSSGPDNTVLSKHALMNWQLSSQTYHCFCL